MNRMLVRVCLAALLPLASAAPLACSRDADIGSPYMAPDAALPPGFLAAVRIDLGASPLARVFDLETGDPAVLHLFVLDAEVAGGDQAAVFSGPGAAELETVLTERGLLSESKQNGSFRLGSHSIAGATDAPMLNGPFGAALGLLTSTPLRRFEVGGRIVFAPTIDVRADLLSIDAAATTEVGGTTEVAVALEGSRLSRVLRRRLRESLGPLGQMAVNQASQHRGVAQAGAMFDTPLDLLGGVRFLQTTYGKDGARARLRIRRESGLAGIVSTLRPIAGDWPLIDEGGFKLAFACDPSALVAAMKRFTGQPDIPSIARLLEWWDGRLAGTFALDRMELTRVALGVVPNTTPEVDDVGPLSFVDGDLLAGAASRDGWFSPPTGVVRYGPITAPPGVFALVRDGKIPVERAREVLRAALEGDDLVTVTWSGLQAP